VLVKKNNYLYVSIIIPAKNVEEIIEKCLTSINLLEYPKDFSEVIVVDNGSIDATKSIAQKMGAKVLEKKRGTIASLRNLGASRARGDILAFLDADMVVCSSWLKNAIYHLKDKKIGAVGSMPKVPENATWVEKTWSLIKKRKSLQKVKWISSGNFIMRREVFEEIGGFNENLLTCEDADIGYRLNKKYNLVNDNAIGVIHLREPKSLIDFFKKEIWHGSHNVKGLFNHGIIFSEIPSLIIPLINLFFIIMLPITIIFLRFNFTLIIFNLLGIIFFPLVYTLRKLISYRNNRFTIFPKMFIIYFIYFLSRSFAFFYLIT